MKDDEFKRGKNPMTKMEVRNTIISYLELEKANRVLDIGAGTGSVSIQMAKQCPHLQVDALEMTETGIELIKENVALHQVQNVMPILGVAPFHVLNPTFKYDRVYIGGSGKKLLDIMHWLEATHLSPQAIVVFSVITMQSLSAIFTYLENNPLYCELEGSMIQASRLELLGNYHYFAPLNPCYIIKCRFGGINV